MEETTQLNIRISKAMIYDMEYIAENLKMNRNDWLKYKIAEMVSREKLQIMETIEEQFIKGLIDEKKFYQKMGFKPTEELRKLKEKVGLDSKKAKIAARQYLQDMLKKIKETDK